MENKEICKMLFGTDGELILRFSDYVSERFVRVFWFDEKEEKEISDIKTAVNRNLSLRGEKKDGSIVCLQAADEIYETMASTWFDAENNIQYFARKGMENQFLLSVWKTGAKKIKKGGCFAKRVDVDGDRLTFHTLPLSFEVKDAELLFWNKKNHKKMVYPVEMGAFFQGTIEVDLGSVKDMMAEECIRWDVLLRVRVANGSLGMYRLEDEKNIKCRRGENALLLYKKRKKRKERARRFFTPICSNVKVQEERLLLSPFFTEDMQFSLQGVIERKAYMRAFHETITDVRLTDTSLTIEICCEKRGFHIKGLRAVYIDDESIRMPFREVKRQEKKDKIHITYSCQLTDMEWIPVSYHLVVEEEKDGITYDVRPKNFKWRFQRQFYRIGWKNTTEMGNKILILLGTKRGNVVIRYREKTNYDKLLYRKRERLARMLYYMGKPFWDRKGIVLMCERFSTAAQDNGVHMFAYYMEQGRKNVYYVIRYDMSDYQKVKQYGKQVVEFMSVRHMIYVQAAKAIVSTDTRKHAYRWLGPNSHIEDALLTKPLVFLQHGVLGMKKVSRTYDRYRSNAADLFITSSELEKKIVNESFHYEPERIAVTGLARWDVLFDKSDEREEKEILFIPTWRSWMDNVEREDFLKSEYYRTYKHLLESERLDDILRKNNLRMIFCMHHKFREFAEEFPKVSERIERFDFGDTPVNELIMRSSCLVTDYSSVAWDSFYLKKPCIFYQFDYERYMKNQGSYLDMENELFGVRVKEEDALLDAIEECIKSGFNEKEEHAALREEYLPYREGNHRQRIELAIQGMNFKGKTEVF